MLENSLSLLKKRFDETGSGGLSMKLCRFYTCESKQEFVSIQKLSSAKTSEAIMVELENMFIEKNIDKTKFASPV